MNIECYNFCYRIQAAYTAKLMLILLACKYAIRPSLPSSLPAPLCLYPPKGEPRDGMKGAFIPTVPALILDATRMARAVFAV
jgi:hypothetical protein